VAIVPCQSFADISRGGIVERHVRCAQSPMHFVESAAPSGSRVGCTLQWTLGAEINKQVQ